jgi:ribosomal protein L11 methyltransferase
MTTRLSDQWLQLGFDTCAGDAEALSEALESAGALSVSLQDSGDDPIYEPEPGASVLWPTTHVVGLFAPDVDPHRILKAVQVALGLADIPGCRIRRLKDRVWERVWLDHFQPSRFGDRLWIVPSGYDPPQPRAINLYLDPGLAFGTGTHATTALCLEWLDRHPPTGEDVLDYGCGSGILAIAAVRLGARHAWAVDIDEQALRATCDNAARNDVAERITVMPPENLGGDALVDCLLANILARPLAELAPRLAALLRSGGRLVLSGILTTQRDEVLAAYQSRFRFHGEARRDDWLRLELICT